MSDKMREAFESRWGYTNEEQDCYFIPELNTYGSARVNRAAESKSTAWHYFQRGWKAFGDSMVVQLTEAMDSDRGFTVDRDEVREILEAAGIKVAL